MDYTTVWHSWSNEFLRLGDGEQAVRGDTGLLELDRHDEFTRGENQFVIHGAPPR
jgi:hypothetical protein